MYIFYLDGIPLPITPSKLKMKYKNKNTTVDLVNGGEFNFVALPGLTEISFKCVFPKRKYPFSIYLDADFRPPEYYLDMLEAFKRDRKAFNFSVIRSTDRNEDIHNTSMYVTLEDCEVDEDATDGSDFTANVTLLQYENQSTKTVTVYEDGSIVVAENVTGTGAADERVVPDYYTVKDGDTLWAISQKLYGDGEEWRTLYEKNKLIIEAAAVNAGYRDSLGGCIIISGTVLEL